MPLHIPVLGKGGPTIFAALATMLRISGEGSGSQQRRNVAFVNIQRSAATAEEISNTGDYSLDDKGTFRQVIENKRIPDDRFGNLARLYDRAGI